MSELNELLNANLAEMPLVLVISRLHTGGAERVVAAIANAWSQQGRKVHIVLTGEKSVKVQDEYPVGSQIRRHYVGRGQKRWWQIIYSPGLKSVIFSVLDKVYATLTALGSEGEKVAIALAQWRYAKVSAGLHKIFAEIQPSVVMIFGSSIFPVAFVACEGSDIRVVAMERNDPARDMMDAEKRLFRRLMHERADMITANSHSAVERIGNHVAQDKIAYLPNPLYNNGLLHETILPEMRHSTILIVARLVPQKNHEVLFKAFAKLPAHLSHWRLSVLGDGIHSQYLMELAKHLQIAERIDWHRYTPDPFAYYRQASIFVLPSQYEGQSNAVLEAMSLGLPVIVSDTPALAEMVCNGENGVVVPCNDVGALAAALRQLAEDQDLRERLGKCGREMARQHDLPAVLPLWDEMIATTCAKKR